MGERENFHSTLEEKYYFSKGGAKISYFGEINTPGSSTGENP